MPRSNDTAWKGFLGLLKSLFLLIGIRPKLIRTWKQYPELKRHHIGKDDSPNFLEHWKY
jgi:hypothetical protein